MSSVPGRHLFTPLAVDGSAAGRGDGMAVIFDGDDTLWSVERLYDAEAYGITWDAINAGFGDTIGCNYYQQVPSYGGYWRDGGQSSSTRGRATPA